MSDVPEPLTDAGIEARLAGLPGWKRAGDEITRTFRHTYHECVHLAVYVAAKAREVGHHPDMHITWQRIEFRITTHDAGHKLTEADFSLAKDIDAIAAAGGATPEDLSHLQDQILSTVAKAEQDRPILLSVLRLELAKDLVVLQPYTPLQIRSSTLDDTQAYDGQRYRQTKFPAQRPTILSTAAANLADTLHVTAFTASPVEAPWRVLRTCHTAGKLAVRRSHSPTLPVPDQHRRRTGQPASPATKLPRSSCGGWRVPT